MGWSYFLLTFAAAYLAICLLVFLFQSNLVYYPQVGREIAMTPADAGLKYEPVKISTEDGVTLDAWYIPANQARGTLVFFHGNAGNISHRMDILQSFHQLGLNTLIVDYRGYGRSTGEASEQGTYLDAEAAWRYLTETKRAPAENIVLFGESLGGAVAAWLAARKKPRSLIMMSTFTSAPELAAKHYWFLPVKLLARFDYNTLGNLKAIACPVLIIHSPEDEIVPFEHGRALFDAAKESRQFLQIRGGHNDGFILSREIWQNGVGAFLDKHLPRQP